MQCWRGRRFPAELRRAMLRKLAQVDAAERLDDLRVRRGVGWGHSRGTAAVSTASA